MQLSNFMTFEQEAIWSAVPDAKKLIPQLDIQLLQFYNEKAFYTLPTIQMQTSNVQRF